VGEAAARTWGLIAGTPDAIKAAWDGRQDNADRAAGRGRGKNINPKNNPTCGRSADRRQRSASRRHPVARRLGIHSFFNFLGYRAEIEAQAYRQAAKEGLSPLGGDAFWQRRAELADQPTLR
jgi:hypothetical protein